MNAQRPVFTVIAFFAALAGCKPLAGTPGPTASAPAPVVPPAGVPLADRTPAAAAAKPEPRSAVPAVWSMEAFALPGAMGPVSLDYLFFERQKARVWVPAGGTGSVAVFDIETHAFAHVDGFKTAEREAHGKKGMLGPSAGAVGDGVSYIGNRATHEVCAVDLQTLKTETCLKLAEATDGVAYVAATREVWVTTPHAQSLTILDASKPGSLKLKSSVKVPGDPEGYAVDDTRGLFLTNLEDKGSTLAIDLKTHTLKATWNAGCSSEGPRGIAVDSARGLTFVACTDHVRALDMNHGGSLLGRMDTGEGVDNIDYAATSQLLYVAAGKAAKLSVIHVADGGVLTLVATGQTTAGARNAVVDESGAAYLADPRNGRLLLLRAPAR